MKTSYYFSNRIREPDLNLVGVSNSYPRKLLWLKGIRTYKPLCPGWSLVKNFKQDKISQYNYIEMYQEKVLDKLDPEKVFHDLGENAIVLCWEKPGKFCHRRLIAEWFYDRLQIKVNEL
jgi:uncharacterized protein (DUF488 family)